LSKLFEETRSLKAPVWGVIPRAAWPLVVAIAIGALVYFGVSPLVGGFVSKVMLIVGINIVLAVSLNIVNGYTGQFSMGHAGFMAVGGYVAAGIVYYGSIKLWGSAEPAGGILSIVQEGPKAGPLLGKGDFLFVISCLIGGLVAAGAGYVVGLPSLRLRGDYLAIVTLGFGEIVRVILQGSHDQIQPWKAADAAAMPVYELAWKLGGPKGFNLVPTYTTLFWVYFWAALTCIAAYRLKSSSSGRAFLSIREDEVAAQAMGVDLTKYKVRAFVFSSFFAGVAGGLYALDIGAISAGDLNFIKSFDIIIMVVLGGLGSISGAVLAAVILSILPEALRQPPSLVPWGWVAIAVIALVMGAVLPKGRKYKPIIVLVGTAALWEGLRFLATSAHVNLPDYRMIIYAILLIVLMIVRPQGLFGVRELWDLKVFKRRGGGA